MLPHGIRTVLLDQTSVTNLVPSQTIGKNTVPSVFTDNPMQGAVPPYVVIESQGTDPMMTLEATYNNTLVGDDIDIVSYAFSIPAARALNDAIRAVFQDFIGAAGSNDTIKAVGWTAENYSYVYPDDGRDTKFHKITTSYHVLSTPS